MALTKRITGAVLFAGTLTACLAQTSGTRISVNSVGFLPNLDKKASVKVVQSQIDGPASPDSFTVARALDDSIVFRGRLGNNVIASSSDTRDTVRIADFTALREPGRYYIASHGLTSVEFDIGDNAFNEAYRAMMLGMYLWRCGTVVNAEYNGKTYAHAECHINDGNLQYVGGGGTRDAAGGWHDAGDFNKYVVNSGVSTGLLLKAWEHHGEVLDRVNLESDNIKSAAREASFAKEGGIPPYLAEIKWNIDWVAKMQLDDGKVSHKLSTLDFCGYIMPNEETETRYFTPWGSPATGAFVGILAQASRIYKPYDAELAQSWLEKAKASYEVLMANPNTAPNQSGFSTGGYGAHDSTFRRWAAVELWETTGEEKYLNDYENAPITNVYAHLGWADVQVLAAMTYLWSEREGRRQSRVDSLRNNVITAANSFVTATNSNGYGRASGYYYWGAHGAFTASTYLLNTAAKLTASETDRQRYRNAGHEILGHIFGRNYFNRSYVTGVGHNPPIDPHDRRSIASRDESLREYEDTTGRMPWPGYLVGGPHSGNLKEQNGAPIAPAGASCASNAVCYFDYYADYARNEIAINWNASMIYALSAYLEPQEAPVGVISGRRVSAKSAAPKIKAARLVQVRRGRGINIPVGAKIYSLNGRLIAHRKTAGDMPVIRKNGVFIMKIEERR